jgi:uncharacterized Tic20 family protein
MMQANTSKGEGRNNMAELDKLPMESREEPVRIAVDAVPQDNEPDGVNKNASVDALVRDYEAKYNGFRDQESAYVRQAAAQKAKSKVYPSMINANLTEEERMWAAIAHGSAILTLLVGLLTGGVATLFTLFIPLGIYIAFRNRSSFVANQALQAFALQVIGTIGWLVVLIGGVLIGALLSVVLAITVVGLIIVPFVVIAIVLFVLATLVMPFGMGVFGAIAAWEAYQGRWYRYPKIGDWVDRQFHTNFLVTL